MARLYSFVAICLLAHAAAFAGACRCSVVGVAALVLALWQIANHVFLMEMEMAAYHLTSFFVETGLAMATILWAVHHRDQACAERDKRERLAAVVAAAMVSSDTDVSPIAGLMKSLDTVRQCTEHMPAVQEELRSVEQYARRIRATNQGLEQILVCEAEG